MVLLEVERKFNWTMQNFQQLRMNLYSLTHLPSLHPVNLTSCAFHDTYYDSQRKLSNNGLWLRKRKPLPGRSQWEAKLRKGANNNFVRTTFMESKDIRQILKRVRKILPEAPGSRQNFGLDELCTFLTYRWSFKVEKKFHVVLDETCFGHRVGEVEVMAEDADKAHAEIDAFMQRHAWFFDTDSNPKGKLTAYFEKFGYPGEGHNEDNKP